MHHIALANLQILFMVGMAIVVIGCPIMKIVERHDLRLMGATFVPGAACMVTAMALDMLR